MDASEAGGRKGDAIAIPGDYQHRARQSGFVVQRYWHWEKERIVRKFCPPEPGSAAIDVGCGSGVIANLLAELGARTTGIDGNPEAIEYASRTFRTDGLSFRRALVEELEFPAGSVDNAYCMEVFEHLYPAQIDLLARRIYELAKPGGRFLVTTPNYRGTWPLLEVALDALRLVPRLHGDQHVTKFHRRRLREVLVGAGWEIERLSTFSTFAPWVSVVSWSAAQAVSAVEDRLGLPFGTIIIAVARKPVTSR
ncbi:MAG: class I SAM-dependent methyltransferase [Gemmatimonadaceae bacterium]